uniref:G-protein coupled receptor Mth-like 2-1 protein n=1 Tax=Dastarcus helophoroides TaxID=1169899 RepID=A0A167L5T8_9CUCU|nr:G-protein coupled receptor Mth-like 2-1 protein [Dastarcus helophoroides]
MFLVCITFVYFAIVSAQNWPCSKIVSVDITGGVKLGNGAIEFNNVTFPKSEYFEEKGRVHGCVCNIRNCVRKCCGEDEIMVNRTCKKGTGNLIPIYKQTEPLNMTHKDVPFHFIYKRCRGYRLRANQEKFFLQYDGTVHIPLISDEFWKPETYCFETFIDKRMNNQTTVILCEETEEEERLQNYIGMIISTPFLLATLIAYALLPDRNLHMKALMSYVFNLLMGYILLVSIQLSQHFSELGCSTIAFCCVFFFMASFFWMNVICIDIWLGFSGLRQISGMKTAETKRFLYYCLYAWGMAVLLVLAVILIDKYAPHDSWYHPEVGRAQCFIRDGTPQLLYFYGPMGIVITINVILFALTALKIRKVKKDTSMLKHSDSKRHSYESDKQRFNLYLKLLFAMGVNWSMELISWAVNLNVGLPQYIWYFTDFCNAVYGVFIFFIFVFKKNIWRQLKRRYYSFMGKPHFAHSMTTNPDFSYKLFYYSFEP